MVFRTEGSLDRVANGPEKMEARQTRARLATAQVVNLYQIHSNPEFCFFWNREPEKAEAGKVLAYIFKLETLTGNYFFLSDFTAAMSLCLVIVKV